VKRGGGVIDLKIKILTKSDRIGGKNYGNSIWVEDSDLEKIKNEKCNSEGERLEADGDMIILYLYISVCEIMGANCVNTILEGISPLIHEITGGRVCLKIISNLSTSRRAKAEFQIPIEKMEWKNIPVLNIC
jgi:hydroxymethylglutaryl-CoA reductase